MDAELQVCLNCHKPLRSGRADKKFCNEGCKNEYHNAQKISEHAELKKITLTLRKNRKILKELLGEKREEIVSHEALLKKGFEFDYHTHFVHSAFKGHQYTFCFNYGYRPVENNKYKVVKSFK